MADSYETLDDEALIEHLTAAASARGERFDIRQVGDRWEACFLTKVSMFGEVGMLSADAAERRAALIELAEQVAQSG